MRGLSTNRRNGHDRSCRQKTLMEEPQELLATLQTGESADPKQVEAVTNLLAELTKTVKIFRTYPCDNSMSIAAVDKLTGSLTSYFETSAELELFVGRDQLLFNSETVYEDNNPRRSMAVKLDRDGVRRLVLSPGITREEIVDFLDVLTTELDEDSLADDIVTLMWDKQFTHLKIFVLDESTDEERYDASKVNASYLTVAMNPDLWIN